MKRVSRFTAYTTTLFLVLALVLAWTGGQLAWAGTTTWSYTGHTGYSSVASLAWNGTNTLYAGSYDGDVYSKTGVGAWSDTGRAEGGAYCLAWDSTDTTLYAGGDGGVYSYTTAGGWHDTGATGAGYVSSLAWNGMNTLYAGGDDSNVYSSTNGAAWATTGGGAHRGS